MKKISVLLFIFCISPAIANNPFFGAHTNQLGFNIGAGVNSGFLIPPPTQFVPFTLTQIQYSRPDTFFTLPARTSMNLAMTIGSDDMYGWDWTEFSIPIVFISQDVILFNTKKFYFGTGYAAGLQFQENERIGTKFILGFKVLTGYKINTDWSLEFFIQHFSNGSTSPNNNSYGFYGIGVGYSF